MDSKEWIALYGAKKDKQSFEMCGGCSVTMMYLNSYSNNSKADE